MGEAGSETAFKFRLWLLNTNYCDPNAGVLTQLSKNLQQQWKMLIFIALRVGFCSGDVFCSGDGSGGLLQPARSQLPGGPVPSSPDRGAGPGGTAGCLEREQLVSPDCPARDGPSGGHAHHRCVGRKIRASSTGTSSTVAGWRIRVSSNANAHPHKAVKNLPERINFFFYKVDMENRYRY